MGFRGQPLWFGAEGSSVLAAEHRPALFQDSQLCLTRSGFIKMMRPKVSSPNFRAKLSTFDMRMICQPESGRAGIPLTTRCFPGDQLRETSCTRIWTHARCMEIMRCRDRPTLRQFRSRGGTYSEQKINYRRATATSKRVTEMFTAVRGCALDPHLGLRVEG